MRLWNILVPYPGETGTYLGASARNIPQIMQREPLIFSNLVGIESRAEKSACRQFDSVPGHHKIKSLGAPNQQQLWNIRSAWNEYSTASPSWCP
jgi:hypothetical protein